MTRITKDLADTIARSTVNEQFKKRADEIRKEEYAIAMELYKHAFDVPMENGKNLLNAVNKVPKNWFRMDKCLRFNCEGYQLHLDVEKAVPVPYSTECRRLADITGPLAKKAQEFASKKQAARDEFDTAYRALKNMIESCGTVKKLHKTWPEGITFYGKYLEATEGANLPAVQIKEINKMLGLKTA